MALTVFRILVVWLAVLMSTPAQARAERIAIVHSYAAGLAWTDAQEQGFKASWPGVVLWQMGWLDGKRERGPRLDLRVEKELAACLAFAPDLIYLTDDLALQRLGPRIPSHIPVVFSGVNAQVRSAYPWVLTSPNITGVLERPLILRGILRSTQALGISPRQVLVLLGQGETGQGFFESDLHGLANCNLAGIQVAVVRHRSFAAWQQEVRAAPGHGFQLILAAAHRTLTDEKGEYVPVDTVNRWLGAHSSLPVMTVHKEDAGVGKLLGGLVLRGEDAGREAARLGRRIVLQGTAPRRMAFGEVGDGTLQFSRERLQHWGLAVQQDQWDDVLFLP